MKLHTIHVNVWFVRYNLIIHFCRLDSRVSMSTTNVSTHKGRLFLAYDSCRCFKKFCSNVSEYSSMARFGFSPKSCTRRKWASEAQWHLKPFSSRHCFSHSWQYQRSFCRPFDFNCFVATLLAVWWTITFSCEVEVIPSTSNVYLLHAATKIQDVKRADKTFFGHGAECSNSWNFGEKFIYRPFRGVPPRPTSHERLNVTIHCFFYHYQIITPYLHPGFSTLRKFVKNLTLQSCMFWSETDDVATMPRRKRSKTTITDPFWVSCIVSQRANPDDAWDYHRNSNLLVNRWLVTPRALSPT